MSELQNIINKIESLLRVAEDSAAGDGERANAQELAQKLMLKYQIEHAMLLGRESNEEIISRRIDINAPYIIDKCVLFAAIARQNYCRVLRGRSYAIVYGYASDIDLVLAMYSPLCRDMEMQMNLELARVKEFSHKEFSTVSFKKSFFAGYTNEIRRRLAKAKKDWVSQSSQDNGDDRYALVLYNKEQDIERFWSSVYKINAGSRVVSNGTGYRAGVDSGSRVDLGQTRLNSRPSLNR